MGALFLDEDFCMHQSLIQEVFLANKKNKLLRLRLIFSSSLSETYLQIKLNFLICTLSLKLGFKRGLAAVK